MKIMRVGDPHVTVRNLAESERLIDFIIDRATAHSVDRIEFMGDLFHTHAVIRMEVLDFWKRAFEKIAATGIHVYALVGNHDQPGSKEKEQQMNSLNIFQQDHVRNIIAAPFVANNIAYIPYMSDLDAFVKASKELYDQGATKCLIAHQTFTGATYENGFYAEDGIDPALVSQEHIISGHIHKQQIIDKCHYIGTPKWDSMSDANQEKGIWIFEHDTEGMVTDTKFISTKGIAIPIIKIVVHEGDEEPQLNPKFRNYLEFHGKTAWISKMKKKYKGQASIKAKPVDRKSQKIDSEKKVTLVDYLNDHFIPIDGVTKPEINDYLKETFSV